MAENMYAAIAVIYSEKTRNGENEMIIKWCHITWDEDGKPDIEILNKEIGPMM